MNDIYKVVYYYKIIINMYKNDIKTSEIGADFQRGEKEKKRTSRYSTL